MLMNDCAITVPDEFKLTPSSLEGTLKFWKGKTLAVSIVVASGFLIISLAVSNRVNSNTSEYYTMVVYAVGGRGGVVDVFPMAWS